MTSSLSAPLLVPAAVELAQGTPAIPGPVGLVQRTALDQPELLNPACVQLAGSAAPMELKYINLSAVPDVSTCEVYPQGVGVQVGQPVVCPTGMVRSEPKSVPSL